MFDHTSRYAALDIVFWTGPDGEAVPYKRRRFLPPPESLQPLADWPVASGDRFDLVAARTLGDSQAWWRIADANRVMEPGELTAERGRHLVIPMPQPVTGF
jgi:hypothetical protein